MASFFEVTLDTTAPPLVLEVSQGPEPSLLLVKLLSDADAFEFRLWGSIDPTDPVTNEGFAEAEGDAEWLPFDEEVLVRVAPGTVNLQVQVRDEVWNESAVEEFSTEVEEPTAPPTQTTPGWPKPKRRTRVKRKVVETTTRLEVRSSSTVVRGEVKTSVSQIGIRSRSGAGSRVRTVTSSSGFAVRSSGTLLSSVQTGTRVELSSHYAIIRRGDSDEEAAILALLL